MLVPAVPRELPALHFAADLHFMQRLGILSRVTETSVLRQPSGMLPEEGTAAELCQSLSKQATLRHLTAPCVETSEPDASAAMASVPSTEACRVCAQATHTLTAHWVTFAFSEHCARNYKLMQVARAVLLLAHALVGNMPALAAV